MHPESSRLRVDLPLASFSERLLSFSDCTVFRQSVSRNQGRAFVRLPYVREGCARLRLCEAAARHTSISALPALLVFEAAELQGLQPVVLPGYKFTRYRAKSTALVMRKFVCLTLQ